MKAVRGAVKKLLHPHHHRNGKAKALHNAPINAEEQEQPADAFGLTSSVASSEGGWRLCQVCMVEPVTTRFQPCCHSVCCRACALEVHARGHGCPVCRAPLQRLEVGIFQGNLDRGPGIVHRSLDLPYVERERADDVEADAQVAWDLQQEVRWHASQASRPRSMARSQQRSYSQAATLRRDVRSHVDQQRWADEEAERRGFFRLPETPEQERRWLEFMRGILARRGLPEDEENFEELRRELLERGKALELARAVREQAPLEQVRLPSEVPSPHSTLDAEASFSRKEASFRRQHSHPAVFHSEGSDSEFQTRLICPGDRPGCGKHQASLRRQRSRPALDEDRSRPKKNWRMQEAFCLDTNQEGPACL